MTLALGGAALWGRQVQQETSPPIQPQAEQSPATPSQAPRRQRNLTPRSSPKPRLERRNGSRRWTNLTISSRVGRRRRHSNRPRRRVSTCYCGRPLVVTSPATISRFSCCLIPTSLTGGVKQQRDLAEWHNSGAASCSRWGATGQRQEFDINGASYRCRRTDRLAALSGQPAPESAGAQEDLDLLGVVGQFGWWANRLGVACIAGLAPSSLGLQREAAMRPAPARELRPLPSRTSYPLWTMLKTKTTPPTV